MSDLLRVADAAKQRQQRRQHLAANPSSASTSDVYQSVCELHDAIANVTKRIAEIEKRLTSIERSR